MKTSLWLLAFIPKIFTDETKIHLATVVDNWKWEEDSQRLVTKYRLPKNVKTVTGGKTASMYIYLSDYNPNDPDSPYAMKYMKGLLFALSIDDRFKLNRTFTCFGSVGVTENVIEFILEVTGYTGKIWNTCV